jgi:hypothetical protein
MQYPDKHTCNTCLKKQIQQLWKQKLATYMHNHCNISNILIYFCNIYMKPLQHTSETSKTLETYTCNIFTLLPDDAKQSGELPVSTSRWLRMVARHGSGQLHLCLAWSGHSGSLMSRTEVERCRLQWRRRRSDHDLLVENGGVSGTSAPPQRDRGRGTTLNYGARGTTHRGGDGAPRCVRWSVARWNVCARRQTQRRMGAL